jgi:LuxR family transcriptional regulator, maltose regulon positive regulatory protein
MRIVLVPLFDLEEAQDMGHMLQTPDRPRPRSLGPVQVDTAQATNVVSLFGTPAAGAVRPAAGDSRSALALRGWLVQSLLLEAIVRDEAGDLDAAGEALERALDLAEHDRVLLPFTVDPVPALLERHTHTRTTHTALITDILHLLAGITPPTPTPTPEPLPEPLTAGETRVLRYLPTNLSKREIADELYVSVATVKTHIHHLFIKLDVHTRGEAVTRALALGLLAHSALR